MRILTLVAGPESLPQAVDLSLEIRQFNSEIDFRLRFLDIEIEELFAAAAEVAPALDAKLDHSRIGVIPTDNPLLAAASLALLLERERPALCVLVGDGPLAAPASAAAEAAGIRIASYGAGPSAGEDALDLGEDAATALERVTGVAREIR